MNLFTLLLKLLWLWRQNQKLPELSKSMKSYCSVNLNMSYDIIFPEIWVKNCYTASGVFLFAQCESPERAAGQQTAFPRQLEQHFQLSPHLPDASCFGQLFTALDLPRKPAYLLFIDFGCYHGYYLLFSFLELSCLSGRGSGLHACWSSTWCQPMYRELQGRNKFPSSLVVLAAQALVCHKNEELSGSSSKNPSCSLPCAAAHAGLVLNHAAKWI